MLCTLAKTFPPHVAKFLERDKGLKRNFREESVTDQLMAALVPFEFEGITVDYPDETKTGGDMEWIFAAPREAGGCKYFRLVLQAKRAQCAKRKTPYYYYHHLDHGTPPGSQADTLMKHAASTSGATATFPVYAFYHPTSALIPAIKPLPAVEGINIVFADKVHAVVQGGCKLKDKKVERWRPHFMTLHDLLCWPTIPILKNSPPGPDIAFATDDGGRTGPLLGFRSFHPDLVAESINLRRKVDLEKSPQTLRATASNIIPPHIRRAIDRELTPEDRRLIHRPRVIFRTNLRSDDQEFGIARDDLHRRMR